MISFTIDSENNIVAHAGTPAAAENRQPFSSEDELAKLVADWPASRLVEIWNGFAGATPFEDLKPLKKFTSRKTAVRRLWEAVARLAPIVTPRPGARGSKPKTRTAKHAPEPTNKKAQVIAMMRRLKGATLADIMEATGWQQHTVRGFVSILGRKGGMNIESIKNASGERCYRVAK